MEKVYVMTTEIGVELIARSKAMSLARRIAGKQWR